MEALHVEKIIERDGEVIVTGLPFKKGQHIEMVITTEPSQTITPKSIKASSLLHSPIIGLWKDRTDITDSAAFARKLRNKAQTRER